MMGLTEKQRQLLDFLRSEAAAGRCPTFEEMTRHVGLRAKSGVFRICEALEQRGHIRRLRGRVRAIEVINPNELARFSSDELRGELARRERVC